MVPFHSFACVCVSPLFPHCNQSAASRVSFSSLLLQSPSPVSKGLIHTLSFLFLSPCEVTCVLLKPRHSVADRKSHHCRSDQSISRDPFPLFPRLSLLYLHLTLTSLSFLSLPIRANNAAPRPCFVRCPPILRHASHPPNSTATVPSLGFRSDPLLSPTLRSCLLHPLLQLPVSGPQRTRASTARATRISSKTTLIYLRSSPRVQAFPSRVFCVTACVVLDSRKRVHSLHADLSITSPRPIAESIWSQAKQHLKV